MSKPHLRLQPSAQTSSKPGAPTRGSRGSHTCGVAGRVLGDRSDDSAAVQLCSCAMISQNTNQGSCLLGCCEPLLPAGLT